EQDSTDHCSGRGKVERSRSSDDATANSFQQGQTVRRRHPVNPVSVDDFRSLTRLLEERRVPFHSFALPEAKTLRAVLRTVPVEISLDDIKSDLVDQGLAPIKVTRM
ncbi:unnamed protein product, partial [Tenebrio molitor]